MEGTEFSIPLTRQTGRAGGPQQASLGVVLRLPAFGYPMQGMKPEQPGDEKNTRVTKSESQHWLTWRNLSTNTTVSFTRNFPFETWEDGEKGNGLHKHLWKYRESG